MQTIWALAFHLKIWWPPSGWTIDWIRMSYAISCYLFACHACHAAASDNTSWMTVSGFNDGRRRHLKVDSDAVFNAFRSAFSTTPAVSKYIACDARLLDEFSGEKWQWQRENVCAQLRRSTWEENDRIVISANTVDVHQYKIVWVTYYTGWFIGRILGKVRKTGENG